MLSQNNVKCLILGKDLTPKTTGTVNEYTDLTDGQAAVVAVGGLCYADGDGQTLNTKIRLVVRNGTKLIYSPFFYGRDVSGASSSTYVAPVEQISYIGYNGSGNSINVISDNEYVASIKLIELDNTGKDSNYIHGDCDTDSSATALEIVESMIVSFIANRDSYGVKPVAIGRVCSVPVATGYGFDGNHDATIVRYSKYITVGTNLQYNTGTELAVGDYVRIGSVAGGTALTSHVYKVTEIVSTTVFKIDQGVEEASGSYAGATDDVRVIPAATIAVANFGFKITTLARSWEAGLKPFSKNRFSISLKNFGTTVVTNSTGAKEGSGYYQAVGDLEWFAQQNEGASYRAYPYESTLRSEVNSAVGYRLLGIKTYDKTAVSSVVVPNSPEEIIIAAPTGGNNAISALRAVLDDCFAIATL